MQRLWVGNIPPWSTLKVSNSSGHNLWRFDFFLQSFNTDGIDTDGNQTRYGLPKGAVFAAISGKAMLPVLPTVPCGCVERIQGLYGFLFKKNSLATVDCVAEIARDYFAKIWQNMCVQFLGFGPVLTQQGHVVPVWLHSRIKWKYLSSVCLVWYCAWTSKPGGQQTAGIRRLEPSFFLHWYCSRCKMISNIIRRCGCYPVRTWQRWFGYIWMLAKRSVGDCWTNDTRSQCVEVVHDDYINSPWFTAPSLLLFQLCFGILCACLTVHTV